MNRLVSILIGTAVLAALGGAVWLWSHVGVAVWLESAIALCL